MHDSLHRAPQSLSTPLLPITSCARSLNVHNGKSFTSERLLRPRLPDRPASPAVWLFGTFATRRQPNSSTRAPAFTTFDQGWRMRPSRRGARSLRDIHDAPWPDRSRSPACLPQPRRNGALRGAGRALSSTRVRWDFSGVPVQVRSSDAQRAGPVGPTLRYVVVARDGLEPPTRGFSVPCSTN